MVSGELSERKIMESKLCASLDLYEDELSKMYGGKRMRANRTRQAIARWGIVGAAKRQVMKNGLAQGFHLLAAAGKVDQTFEAIIARYPNQSHSSIVAKARGRLERAKQKKND